MSAEMYTVLELRPAVQDVRILAMAMRLEDAEEWCEYLATTGRFAWVDGHGAPWVPDELQKLIKEVDD